MPADDLGALLGYDDAPKVAPAAAPDLGKLLGYGDEPKTQTPAPVLPSQTVPTPEQVDADTSHVAQVTAAAMRRARQGPQIGAPAQTPWYAQSFDDSGMGGGVSLGGNLVDSVVGEGSAIGQAIRQNHPQLAHLLGIDDAKQPDYRDQPQKPLNMPLVDARALKAEKLVPGNGAGAKIARGVIKAGESFAGGMTTPGNAELATATGGMGEAVPLVRRLISAGFSAQMLLTAYREYPEIREAMKSGDPEKVAEAATRAGLTTLAGLLAAWHGLKGEGAKEAPAHSEAPTSPIDLRGAATEAAAAQPGGDLGQILYPEEKSAEPDFSGTKRLYEASGAESMLGIGTDHTGKVTVNANRGGGMVTLGQLTPMESARWKLAHPLERSAISEAIFHRIADEIEKSKGQTSENAESTTKTEAQPEGGRETEREPHAGAEPGAGGPAAGEEPRGLLEPEPAPAMTRLYRVDSPKQAARGVPEWMEGDPKYEAIREATGRWFAEDPDELPFYLRDSDPGAVIRHVDVPTADLEKYRVSNQPPEIRKFSARPEHEFFLPREIAERRVDTHPDLLPGHVRAQYLPAGPDGKPVYPPQFAPAPKPEQMSAGEESGPHGPILTGFRHDAQGAIAELRRRKSGDAIGALHHSDIGDIDLVWGKPGPTGYGLAHIESEHPGIADRLQEIISGLEKGKVARGNRQMLVSPDHEAVVRLDWDDRQKHWLLTAYEKTPRSEELLGGSESSQEPEGPTTPSQGDNSSVEAPRAPEQAEERRGPRVLRTSPAYGNETTIHVAGEPTTWPARYALIDARDAIPSHNAQSFAPNPDYEHENERDYSAAGNSARVVEGSAEGRFQPDYVTTESPTAEHGPPIDDERFNTLGGNNRTMMVQRVYERGGEDAQRLYESQRELARRAGISPEDIDRFEQPFVRRQLAEPGDAQKAIRDFNKTASAALSPEEQAVADGKRLWDATVHFIAAQIEDAGPDGTLAQAIRGDNGAALVNRLVSDGVLTRQEANGLTNERDQLTPAAKDRIAKMLLGRLFDTAKDLKNAPPELRNKLERIAPHVLRVEGNPEWNLTDRIREALGATEEARAHGIRNFGDLENQESLTGEQRTYSPDAIAIARTLQGKPTAAERAFRRYANDEKTAREGGTIFEPPTRDEAFGDAFNPSGAERGGIDPELLTLGAGKFWEKDIAPALRRVVIGIVHSADDILKVLAPTLRGGRRVEQGKLAMRGRLGEMARRGDQARAALRSAERFFNRQSVESNYDFWDRIEAGQKQANPALDAIAGVLRKLLDGRREDVQQLGTGKLRNFYENYMPRAWQDTRKATAVIREFYARRPFEGGKSFLKKRTYPTMAEGRAAGLKPVTDNPVTMALLKIHEMDRYIAAHRTLNDWKAAKSAMFVDARDTEVQQRMRRAGWTQIPDPIGTVYGPSVQPIAEYPNEGKWNALEAVAKALGITHERGFLRMGDAIGRAYRAKPLVRTMHGTAEDVLGHEIGHQIDFRAGSGKRFIVEYPDRATVERIKQARATIKDTKGTTLEQRKAARKEIESLKDAIQDRKQFAKELRDLADLRGGNPDYTHKREEKMALLAQMWTDSRELFERTAPHVFDLWKRFLDENPKLHALRDLEGNAKVTGIAQPYDVGGVVVKGHFWAPEGLSRIMGNHLMPSLMEKPVFRGMMGVNNALNLFNLGLSAFHVGKTALESSISKGALAYEATLRGRPFDALKHAAGVPAAPFTAFLRGDKMLREWYAPGSQGEEIGRLADLATAAGARARMDEMYRTRTATAMVQALRDGNLIGAGLRAPFAAMEGLTNLIMDQVVPRLKHGVFADMAAQHLKQLGPDPDASAVQRAMANDWNSVENRLGEVTRDNLFWRRYARDLGVMLMRADQWTLGTVRELGGAAADLVAQPMRAAKGAPVNLNRLTYAASMITLHMAYSALYQYLRTGKKPDELEDYFFPRNGETDELGRPQRSVLPSYVKDVYEFARHPVRAAENKAAAGITLANDLIHNEQYDRTEIHHPGDPAAKQMGDTAKFIGQQFTPFSVRNFHRERELGQSPAQAAEQFVGINPAPSDLNDGPGARLARDLAGEDAKPRTAEEAERSHLRRELTRSLRLRQSVPAEVLEARRSGKLSPRDISTAIRAAHETPLERTFNALGVGDALRVYRAADAHEKTEVRGLLLKKARAALQNAPPAGRAELAREVREALR
jgi:hypothetical protein